MQYIGLTNKNILITGAAGFIGANLVLKLLSTSDGQPVYRGLTIIGIDNMNDYYDVSIKEWRLQQIEEAVSHTDSAWTFVRGSVADKSLVDSLFEQYKFDIVVNLAAQAGVRYSITNPDVYIEEEPFLYYFAAKSHVLFKYTAYIEEAQQLRGFSKLINRR